METAANRHPAEDAKRLREEEDERRKKGENRQKRQEIMHTDYLNSRGQQTRDSTPVGLRSPVFPRQPFSNGVFKVEFDFGTLERVKIICPEESAHDEYCARANGDDKSYWDDSADEERTDDEETDGEASIPVKGNPKLGAKRKPPASESRSRPKKHKAGQDQPREYLLKLNCRETGEGMIHFEPSDGTIDLQHNNLASFEGEADYPCVGHGVSFFARKVSDVPCRSGKDWTDYSERQNEIERVNRWHEPSSLSVQWEARINLG